MGLSLFLVPAIVRYDIIQDLRHLYDEVKDETIRDRALKLIESEEDTKYRKKYATLLRRPKAAGENHE